MDSNLSHAPLETIRTVMRERSRSTHGVVRRSDLARAQIPTQVARTLLRRGWWVRLHHGVYIDSDDLAAATSAEARARIMVMASARALSAPAYAFATTAALLHGLPVDSRKHSITSMVRPITCDQRALHRRISGPRGLADVHVHSHHLHDDDVVTLDGVPTVSRDIAAITSAASHQLDWAVASLDAVAWKDETAGARLAKAIEPWRGLKGIGIVRQALPLMRTGAQTPLESLSRVRLIDRGLPEPTLQLPVYDEEGLIGYADMAWQEQRVIGEADGLLKYSGRDDLLREKTREDRLRRQGWFIARWTWTEILERPEAVAARIRSSMALARQVSA